MSLKSLNRSPCLCYDSSVLLLRRWHQKVTQWASEWVTTSLIVLSWTTKYESDTTPWKNIITKEEHFSLLRECDLCGWLPGGFFIFTADTSSLLMNKAEAFALGTADRKNSPPFLHKFVRPLPPWKIHNSISSSVDPSSPSLGSRTIEPNPSVTVGKIIWSSKMNLFYWSSRMS